MEAPVHLGRYWGRYGRYFPYKAIPQAVQKFVMAKRQEFIKGTAHPFDGPVKDQTAKVKVPAGQVLDDKAQLAMDWYVQGIETRG